MKRSRLLSTLLRNTELPDGKTLSEIKAEEIMRAKQLDAYDENVFITRAERAYADGYATELQ